MQFENANIENLIAQYQAFSVEGFNIFAKGKDNLPHLICVCPNKPFARAIQALLIIAKRAQNLQAINAEINSTCYLAPMLLADGRLALVVTVIDDAVWKNGNEVEYDESELQLGSTAYEDFVKRFCSIQETGESTAVLQVYEVHCCLHPILKMNSLISLKML